MNWVECSKIPFTCATFQKVHSYTHCCKSHLRDVTKGTGKFNRLVMTSPSRCLCQARQPFGAAWCEIWYDQEEESTVRFVLFFMRITRILSYFMACIRGKNKPRLQSTPFLATEFVKFCCEKTYLLKFVSVFCQPISHNLSLVYWNQNKLCVRSCCFTLASAWPSQQRDQHVVGTVGGAVASGHTGPFYSSFIDFHIHMYAT